MNANSPKWGGHRFGMLFFIAALLLLAEVPSARGQASTARPAPIPDIRQPVSRDRDRAARNRNEALRERMGNARITEEEIDHQRRMVREQIAAEILRAAGGRGQRVAEDEAIVLDLENEIPTEELIERYPGLEIGRLVQMDEGLKSMYPTSAVWPGMPFPSDSPDGSSESGSGENDDATDMFGAAAAAGLMDDPDVRDVYRRWLILRLEREIEILAEQRSVITITNNISWFIFVVVHIILLFGLWAAIKEFRQAGRTRMEKPQQTDLRISLEGVALKTALHGLLLLAMAFGFYFLYLKFVYPVTVLPA